MNYQQALNYAKSNRSNQTVAEKFFWENVRAKRFHAIKFNRQFIIEYSLSSQKSSSYFIVDFYCHKYKLIIEIDGRIHDYQKEYDQYRTEILEGLGLRVVRFSNDEVLNNWSAVKNSLLSYFKMLK